MKLIKGLILICAMLLFSFEYSDFEAKQRTKTGSKPKFSAPTRVPRTRDKNRPKPKFSAPSPKPVSPVGKPSHKDGPSEKARAAREVRSAAKWQETKKATAPPVAKYTSPEGKTVNVRTGSKDVEYIRNLPSSSIKPEVRQQNITVHVTKHYHHPYTYYASQPVVYVGGGYSSTFWWMMMEWDAERRARWLYNNRYNIEADAYARGIMDAQVAQSIARLEDQRAHRDGGYVDPEFSKDRSLMYTDAYVKAAYNPVIATPQASHTAYSAGFWFFLSVICLGVLLWLLYMMFFKVRWGS